MNSLPRAISQFYYSYDGSGDTGFLLGILIEVLDLMEVGTLMSAWSDDWRMILGKVVDLYLRKLAISDPEVAGAVDRWRVGRLNDTEMRVMVSTAVRRKAKKYEDAMVRVKEISKEMKRKSDEEKKRSERIREKKRAKEEESRRKESERRERRRERRREQVDKKAEREQERAQERGILEREFEEELREEDRRPVVQQQQAQVQVQAQRPTMLRKRRADPEDEEEVKREEEDRKRARDNAGAERLVRRPTVSPARSNLSMEQLRALITQRNLGYDPVTYRFIGNTDPMFFHGDHQRAIDSTQVDELENFPAIDFSSFDNAEMRRMLEKAETDARQGQLLNIIPENEENDRRLEALEEEANEEALIEDGIAFHARSERESLEKEIEQIRDLKSKMMARGNLLSTYEEYTERIRALTFKLGEENNFSDLVEVLEILYKDERLPEDRRFSWWSLYLMMSELYRPVNQDQVGESDVEFSGKTYATWVEMIEGLAKSSNPNTLNTWDKEINKRNIMHWLSPLFYKMLIERLEVVYGVKVKEIIESVLVYQISANQLDQPDIPFTEEEIKSVWNLFFHLIILMKTLAKKNIHLTNLILSGRKYKKMILDETGTYVRYLQAFPYVFHQIEPTELSGNDYTETMIAKLMKKYIELDNVMTQYWMRGLRFDIVLRKERTIVSDNPFDQEAERKEVAVFTLKLDVWDDIDSDDKERLTYINTLADEALPARDLNAITGLFKNWMKNHSTKETVREWLYDRIKKALLTEERFSNYREQVQGDLIDGDLNWEYFHILKIDIHMKVGFAFVIKIQY